MVSFIASISSSFTNMLVEVTSLSEIASYWQTIASWVGRDRRTTITSFLDKPALRPLFDFFYGLNITQLPTCLPVLHLALAAFAQAPNTPQTMAMLYDEIAHLFNPRNWETRASEDETGHEYPYLNELDVIRRGEDSKRDKLLPLISRDPIKFCIDICMYLMTFAR